MGFSQLLWICNFILSIDKYLTQSFSVFIVYHKPLGYSKFSLDIITPVHLIDSSGNLTHSALIPYCSYGSNLSILSQSVPGLKFSVFTGFYPTLLDGQLCYRLDINDELEKEDYDIFL